MHPVCRPDVVCQNKFMANQRRTSPKAAKSASKVLRSKSTGKHSKVAAGSALSQAAPKRRKK
ncbi:hypothetical protein CO174_03190 [Candidatus Uhrbacteria bacterium CG_4_9_14_3_um_filter_50_9]|uniref:Uncharacterized protein n=1 Tax=Candidatus Uhrbacteria bacterium CG_4_9_14_3_um_filter_50_9 TaxID=1975035 RepID=A0A2M7XC17_9BACT|nr:MAG: hypothetical protein CO174_03190 [Candidatus Uhrbacteria bacterium CG_4_9_14_3_um_filter_50_9]